MSVRHYEYREKNGHRRSQQDEDSKVQSADEGGIVLHRGAAHGALRLDWSSGHQQDRDQAS
jgi:hypothetical protein